MNVAFIKMTSALNETTRLPFLRPYPGGVNTPETRMGAYLRSVEIVGPYGPTGPGNTPARERLFVCRPAAASEEGRCARTILSTLARRAYRRPVTDEDLKPLMAFYEDGRAEGGFERGIEVGLQRLLVSPSFLFRVERDPSHVSAGIAYPVSDIELASRLSFFLWSSIPDDQLLDLAAQGKLRQPEVLDRQVRRMLADPRAESLANHFAGQWLFLRNLATMSRT